MCKIIDEIIFNTDDEASIKFHTFSSKYKINLDSNYTLFFVRNMADFG